MAVENHLELVRNAEGASLQQVVVKPGTHGCAKFLHGIRFTVAGERQVGDQPMHFRSASEELHGAAFSERNRLPCDPDMSVQEFDVAATGHAALELVLRTLIEIARCPK